MVRANGMGFNLHGHHYAAQQGWTVKPQISQMNEARMSHVAPCALCSQALCTVPLCPRPGGAS